MTSLNENKDIEQLQLIEQNLQTYISQKQQFQSKLLEINSALTEIESSSDNFKIIGNIMIKKNKEDLKTELDKKKKMVEVQLKSIKKQEDGLREKASQIQKRLQNEIKLNE
jgi:prefoldin beta subunit